MTPRTLVNNAYVKGIEAERTRWRPLFQMLHTLEPALREGREKTPDKAQRAREASRHDLVLELLEMTPTWPAE